MRYTVKSTNVLFPETTELYLQKKMQTLEKAFGARSKAARATVELEKTTRHHQTGAWYRAELNIHVGRTILRAEERGRTLNEAIDLVQEEMAKELRRFADRQTALERKGGRTIKERVRDSRV